MAKSPSDVQPLQTPDPLPGSRVGSLSTQNRTISESHQVAAIRYAKSVGDFADLPDGRGANHALLASFLGKLASPRATSLKLPIEEETFAVSYSYGKQSDAKIAENDTKEPIKQFAEYASCFDFVSRISLESSKPPGRLLFLRGFPSAEWVCLLGAKYRIDPEFFMHFLHFKPAIDATINHSLPALPASSWNILELPIITIGERKVLTGPVDHVEVDDMRKEARVKMQKHHDTLRGHNDVAVASSVVRDVAIIDHSSFALEQRIWVCLQPVLNDNSRWTLIVWTDAGSKPSVQSILNLKVLPNAFQTEATSLQPVIDYKPGTGLKAQKFASLGHVHALKGAEAGSQVCIGYGQTLYEDVMEKDPFYALTEVFNVTTASVNQYLNLIEHKLAWFTDDERYDNADMLSNLRYSKDVLYRQQRQLEQVNAWLISHKLRGGTHWQYTSEGDPKACSAAESVLQRYDYLHTRVKTLQAQCQDAISNLMNNINLKEVKNSYDQSKRIGKLTFLAFVFAPLSFTTSFFAMNIGLKDLSLKTWFAVTIILISITFFIMLFDVIGWIMKLRDKVRDLMKRAKYF